MDKYDYLNFHGQKIFYRLSFPYDNKKHPVIFFIHGARAKADSLNVIINELKDNFICLAFDHLGCGKSDGKFEDYTLRSRLDQAFFVLQYLKKVKNVDLKMITVVGASMGAHIASRLTEKNSFSTLILRAPACYRKDYENKKMVKDWIPWDREGKYWPWRPSLALDAIEKYNGRLLIVKSEKDEVIPDEIINNYLRIATKVKEKKLVVMQNAPHRISDKPIYQKKFASLIKRFIILQYN
ncbi:hypothetical protein A3C98_03080 [Candidatus Roizmanbacteria bacterium RIFCSPHIGHO2_02_FULL_37_15]|uniref:Serine aminopeptidase S33 domain-containing protein n=1 Tax=Candidatus Roizmanbacteria bacterium RIFCSPLOWO2_01_FULL_37_16 TaxID=1802058 RepID=A0A1F7IJ42_9BACT|nr:MAG: hypothetical protein A2859_01140 [Candidatus Roizmanbacteria bacterium RIFCSPHIGHO2_01_FULL_37_16b]OGK21078.1 MAG: hypothetical protein A3C98_03080 [Candidatus Roizmanbacteria bacterium RIFCSPHIGHO2_02_FULL_37_15]OGK31419.1 MAG: hypothetical protein A3F57_01345 [Candidatus Roizmanbacteria bacterium RIFCSPHIGHO2_12_FULL_36_11]OGK43360.1 MAG: hypothetical protein A3B40_01015 [Candidatus Roizmanbacteria bacterium RIFCSPLOWO2_01_FULL_37_16]OGK57593.1 MAG: hypothetical protein A3I50_00910 [C